MIPTSDPNVYIEEKRESYWRYIDVRSGVRWEIEGVCDRRGDCMIGAVVDGIEIKSHGHLAALCSIYGKDRIDSDLDVPVVPGFKGCCPLEGRWL